MRKMLLTVLVAVMMALPATAQAQGVTTIAFISCGPGAAVIATLGLDATVSAETLRACSVDLMTVNQAFRFPTARQGQARKVAEVGVRVGAQIRTVGEVSAELDAALSGRVTLVLLRDGQGTVLGMTRIGASADAGLNTRVDAANATRVTLIVNGQVQNATIVKTGPTLGSIIIRGDSAAGANASIAGQDLSLAAAVDIMARGSTQQPSVDARAAVAIFFEGAPAKGGHILATVNLTASATAEMRDATYVQIRVRGRSFTFALAKVGATAGESTVRLNAQTKTVAEVAGMLDAAIAGKINLVIFTQGSGSNGVVVSIMQVTQSNLNATVNAAGATYVTIIVEGQVQEAAIVRMGSTLGSIVVEGGGSVGGNVQGNVESLLDILKKKL